MESIPGSLKFAPAWEPNYITDLNFSCQLLRYLIKKNKQRKKQPNFAFSDMTDSHSSWHLLNVYLSPEEHVQYQQFLYLSDYIRDLNAEVVVWGHFNDILSPEEKRGNM
ncbi:hypothetical protein RHMOL_Rhmol01G0063000 [Rhododendron molle]|uniref:Uncharacterized protein n=1 Tax=Rhododendron molle TaxID=49168 RepID=A0ACC0Q0I1_RHOML|nr:hypothetical protein RHMOL_Rhmol01G0063000 [Rhododendron molle]